MNVENAIEVKNLTKSFKVYLDKGAQLKERLLFWERNRYEVRQILNDISFSVKKGEAIGLVGHNGCGKSTTLKLLTKIIYPNSGSVELAGRVSSLIELGAGFHPDMSGRENIYTNAAIFGLSKKEIDARMDDIIAFSELEEFLDNPVRTYSSGMYMRLAFSVAINVNADILLIDEILAVGDANFQAKCFNRLQEIKAAGTTIVIVSHSLDQIERICDRSLWIHDGQIRAEGSPKDVHLEYLTFMGEERRKQAIREKARREGREPEIEERDPEELRLEAIWRKENTDKRWGNGYARITEIHLLNSRGEETNIFTTGEDITLDIRYEVRHEVLDAVFGIGLFRIDGAQCYGTNTRIDRFDNFDLKENGRTIMHLHHVNLIPGEYLLDATIEWGDGIPVDYYREIARLTFQSPIGDVGLFRVDHSWELFVEEDKNAVVDRDLQKQ